MDKRKKYIMIIDTETTGGLNNPLTYDISFIVCDKKEIYTNNMHIYMIY